MSENNAVLDPSAKAKDKPKKSDKKPTPPKKPKKPPRAAADPEPGLGKDVVISKISGDGCVASGSAFGALVDIFKLASDRTRLRVVCMLRDGPKNVGEICASLSQSQPAISHHLSMMKFGGVLQSERRGKNNYYSLARRGEILATSAEDLFEAIAT
jgi:DNA-binding transcriptional ArsR family regulator